MVVVGGGGVGRGAGGGYRGVQRWQRQQRQQWWWWPRRRERLRWWQRQRRLGGGAPAAMGRLRQQRGQQRLRERLRWWQRQRQRRQQQQGSKSSCAVRLRSRPHWPVCVTARNRPDHARTPSALLCPAAARRLEARCWASSIRDFLVVPSPGGGEAAAAAATSAERSSGGSRGAQAACARRGVCAVRHASDLLPWVAVREITRAA